MARPAPWTAGALLAYLALSLLWLPLTLGMLAGAVPQGATQALLSLAAVAAFVAAVAAPQELGPLAGAGAFLVAGNAVYMDALVWPRCA